MVKIYESIYDENLNVIPGRTKLFIKETLEDGAIGKHDYGIAVTPEQSGTLFIVDDWLIPQRHKLLFIDGELSVKDGEELIPPVKTEKELQIEAIERQLAALKAEPDVPAEIEEDAELPVDEPSDTEEQTDTPLLDYTEQPSE